MAEQYAADDQRIIQTGQPLLSREERSVDRIGNEVWNLTTKAPLRDSDGKVVGLVGIARDISERKRVEEELKDSEERYRALVQNVPVAVYRTTPGPKGKFLMANPTCLKIFGFDSEEEIKKIDICDLYVNPEGRTAFSETLLSKGKLEGLELALRKKDGSPFWGSVTARLVYDKNRNPYFDTTIMDITDRKKAEEAKEKIQAQLLQVQKMEAIGMLAGGVAHDFNNLLTVIQGCTELAMEKVNETLPLYRDLNQIQLAAMRAASLTRQLLLFSRKQPIEPTPLNINKTIDGLLKMLNRVIGEDIAINTDLEPDLWTVLADAGNIEQVIMNLAVNARDAMPKGGKLTIKTENVTLEEEYYKAMPEARPGKFVRLLVEDTGLGMDKEIIPHIFEPFFSTKGSGTRIGLGLSVVYGIVKHHEGWINVYSEPGRGSTFKVYLPAFSVETEAETKKTISLQELKGSGEWILLVEDEEGVRELATRVLRANGYVVFEAADAKEAIDIFEREEGKFQLVFCDMVLPDKSSLQLVDQLLSRKPELRVLLSSGYAGQKLQWPIIREIGFRFLQKPYALSDLLLSVREAIEQAE